MVLVEDKDEDEDEDEDDEDEEEVRSGLVYVEICLTPLSDQAVICCGLSALF